MKSLLKTLAVAALLVGVAAAAQESFEVASIKPGDPADRRVMIRLQPGGRMTTANVPVIMLIRQAYEVQDFQITGAPDWVKTERWNIDAKMGGADDIDQRKMSVEQMEAFSKRLQACLQSLLEERFGLKAHRESKEMPVYALVVAKGGQKLTEVEKPGPGKPRQMRMGRGELMGTSVQVADLAKSLSERVGRPVEDRTGLKGFYNYTLTWTPDASEMMMMPGPPGPPGPNEPPPPDPNGPSLFTALQEQLGLKLESSKGPVQMLVIDHVERPSAN